MGVNLLTLARYTLKGPYQAAAVVALLAILATFAPSMMGLRFGGMIIASLCMFLSSSLVSLIILTQGSVSGFKAIAVSMLGISLVSWGLDQPATLGLWIGLVQWSPIILLSQALRSSRSLALTLLVGVGLGAIAIIGQSLLVGAVDVDLLAKNLPADGTAGRAASAAGRTGTRHRAHVFDVDVLP